jgi:dynein heavy chain
MRKEADDVGPRAELEHWKRRTAKFNGLLDQIKSPACVHTIGILHMAKSKQIDEWRRLDTRITEEANEAKDNVKYLYNLDSLCEPLYKCTPVWISSQRFVSLLMSKPRFLVYTRITLILLALIKLISSC